MKGRKKSEESKENFEKNKNDGVADAFADADVGDRMWLFFRKNSKTCCITLVTIVAAAFFFLGLRIYSGIKITRMQRAYSSIATEEDRVNFLKKCGGGKLSGIVLLSVGNDHMADGKYELAKLEYKKAGKLLRNSILFPRAEINRAVATYKCGDFASAEKILHAVICSKIFDRSFASDAAHVLVTMMKDAGKAEKLKLFAANADFSAFTPAIAREIRAACAEN
ncbi:MAG: hypothetical protein LBT64_01385 [Puniceicoccales bacterium]|jgi:hypothetical protein|nr:hypothetical protein [Puniceicoccales bacterium]